MRTPSSMLSPYSLLACDPEPFHALHRPGIGHQSPCSALHRQHPSLPQDGRSLLTELHQKLLLVINTALPCYVVLQKR